tara:strand:- start:1883 stop:2281 length:399 start_codon:yes stop_codon:yes gene_type:complete
MDWKECCDRKIAKRVSKDPDLISSLTRSSINKLESEKKLPLNNITASSKISLAYDSLRELLEVLALKNQYKIYNHECYTCFLKEVLKENNKAEKFDEIRRIRNQVNYYGKEISIEEAKESLKKIKTLINQLK